MTLVAGVLSEVGRTLSLVRGFVAVHVPEAWLESVRHLARRREQVRGDVMRARHRVSKLLLIHGRVYPESTTWNQKHRQWLGRQVFEHEATELVVIDLLAALDGHVARREALEERLSRVAQDPRYPLDKSTAISAGAQRDPAIASSSATKRPRPDRRISPRAIAVASARR